MRILRPIVFIAAVVLSISPEIIACTCAFGGGPACQEAWRAGIDAVFLGKVSAIETSSHPRTGAPGAMSMTFMGGMLQVTIDVEESFRGDAGKSATVFTPQSGASCGFHFEKGQSYIVFAHKTKEGELAVSMCSGTRPVANAQQDLAYLRSLRTLPPTGFLEGTLWRYTHDPNFKPSFEPSIMDHYRPPEQTYMAMVPVPGTTVIAKAKDGTEHSTVVDAQGNWKIADLPPGKYEVTPKVDTSTYVHFTFGRVSEVAERGCALVDLRIESNGRISGTLHHGKAREDWSLLKVFVLQLPNTDPKKVFAEADVDLDGSKFEIGPLPKGQYLLGTYVVVRVGTKQSYSLADVAQIYYPGVSDPKQAQPITVGEGEEVKGIELKQPY